MTGKINKAREALTEMFTKSLDAEKLPWNQPWVEKIPGFGKHLNPITGTRYRGINAAILWLVSMEKQYPDPRWCTYKQAQEKGWQVKKGSKGCHIEFWCVYDVDEKKKLSLAEASRLIAKNPEKEKSLKPCCHVYTVFNGSQIDGIPELAAAHHIPPVFQNELLNRFSQRYMEAESITLLEGHSAYYSPTTDSITMPPKGDFVSEIAYYDTLYHECAHSTGVAKRLNRGLEVKPTKEEYAIEELRAEIAGAFLLSETGAKVPESISENNRAYVQSWAEGVKKDPTILFQAIKAANSICDFVVERGQLEGVREEIREEELIDLGGAIHDLALEYNSESVPAGAREDMARYVAENIRQGDTMGLHNLLEDIKTFGGTEEMMSKAGSLLDRLSAYEPSEEVEIEDREEDMEL